MSDELIAALYWATTYVLPILALVGTGIGLLGGTWDENHKRPTRVGYWLLAIGASIAAASLLGTWTGNEINTRDDERNEVKQKVALAEQGLMLLPLRYIELWIPRTDVVRALPPDLASRD
jgi:hypothetical protein